MGIYLMNSTKRSEFKTSDKFNTISTIWNETGLGKPFCVGDVQGIKERSTDLKDFKNNYFKSGEERLNLLNSFDETTKRSNQDYSRYIETKKTPYYSIWQYNAEYGRTREDLYLLASILKEEIDKKEIEDISLEDAYAFVYISILE